MVVDYNVISVLKKHARLKQYINLLRNNEKKKKKNTYFDHFISYKHAWLEQRYKTIARALRDHCRQFSQL